MSRLITFGCSLTDGQALDSRDQAWPQQLANLMNLPVENKGKKGSSTKRIWWEIMQTDFDPNDTVVCLWTHLDRWCIINAEGYTDENYYEWDLIDKAKLKDYIKTTKNITIDDINVHYKKENEKGYLWYKNFHNDFDMLTQYLALVNHAMYWLQSKVKKQYHLRATNYKLVLPFNETEFLPIDFQEIRERHPMANDGWHPGPEAHLEFAEQIFQHISQNE